MKKFYQKAISFLFVAALLISFIPPEVNAETADSVYTISFDPCGGTGSMDTIAVNDGSIFLVPNCDFLAPEKQIFKVWTFQGQEFAPGSRIKVNSDITLTALWEYNMVSEDGKWEISKSKQVNNNSVSFFDPTTEITISLPSAEYKNTIDVIFVIDKSKSTASAQKQFAQSAISMLNTASSYDVHLKIGIIKFRGYASDAIASVTNNEYQGLIEYRPESSQIILDAISSKAPGHGSGIHTGLNMADQWLKEDEEVPDSNKYVVLMTDGKSYIWDENWAAPGEEPQYEPTSIYTQYYRHFNLQNNGIPSINQLSGCDKGIYNIGDEERIVSYNENHTGKTGEQLIEAYYNDFKKLYNSDNTELYSKTKYDRIAKYAGKYEDPAPEGISMEGTLNVHNTSNGKDLFAYPSYQNYYEFIPANSNDHCLEANPYEAQYDDLTGTYFFNPNLPNDDYYMYHVSNLEKGLYKASHLWSDMNEKYHCGAVYYDSWGPSQGLGICIGFCKWLECNSEFAGDITNTDEVNKLFQSIQEDIIYTIHQGTIEDYLGSAFNLCEPINVSPFRLFIGGKEFPAIKDSNNQDTWLFGAPIKGVVPYSVHYDRLAKKIEWEIRVPVENQSRTQLKYNVNLDLSAINENIIYYPTNSFASLSFVSTDNRTGTESFSRPEVTLEPLIISIPINKKVIQTGTEPPEPSYFSFEAYVKDNNGNEISLGTLDLSSDTCSEINSAIEFVVSPNNWEQAKAGIFIREIDKSGERWDYDNTIYVYNPLKKTISIKSDSGLSETNLNTCIFVNQYTKNKPIPPKNTFSATLYKVDSDSKALLKDSVFSLYKYRNGEYSLVGTYTLKDGILNLTGLKAGNYYWQEIKSPEGYTLKNNKYNFTLDVTHSSSVINIENTKTPIPSIFSRNHEAYIIGRESNKVYPNAKITRAEAATIFFRLLNNETRDKYLTRENQFIDVLKSDWFSCAVSTMANLKILEGYPDGTFRPNSPISRAEFAAITARLNPSGIKVSNLFNDISNHWAKSYINISVGSGWIIGYPDGSFKPEQSITRAEAMTLINRVLQRIPASVDNLHPNMITWEDNQDTRTWYYLAIQEATNSHEYIYNDIGNESWTNILPIKDWTQFEVYK